MTRFAIALLLFVASCATAPTDPASAVFAATSTYAGALSVAVAYRQLPPCAQPVRPVLCSDAQVVKDLQRADDAAFAALTAAQRIARTPGAGANIPTALNAANQALAALTAITANLQVK